MTSSDAVMGLLLPFALGAASVGEHPAAPAPAGSAAAHPSAVLAVDAGRSRMRLAAFNHENHAIAIDGHRALADQDSAELQYRLGEMYFRGDSADRDEQAAMRWYRRAAEQGHAEAQFMLGALQLLQGDATAEGIGWLRRSAYQGNEAARVLLAYTSYYSIDDGHGDAPDPVAALRRNLLLAERGDAAAQFALAEAYRTGQGVRADTQAALCWYLQAAGNGHIGAQQYLAAAYHEARVIPIDEREAERWCGGSPAGARPRASTGSACAWCPTARKAAVPRPWIGSGRPPPATRRPGGS